MSKFIYLDCASGISGDMCLGAFIDLGVDFGFLKHSLTKLGISNEYEICAKKVLKSGISATKVDVILKRKWSTTPHFHEHGRTFKDIVNLINSSNLSDFVKEKSIEIFTIIGEAEAKIHQSSLENVHFHEVGCTDSIVDIVGSAICFESLGISRVLCSPLALGGGFVKCAHGILSVPAPAVSEILSGVPVKFGGDFEQTTPTGAGIAKALTSEFCAEFSAKILRTGYGAGSKEAKFANLLKIMICEDERLAQSGQVLIETNIDDMDAEGLALASEILLNAGALDVFSEAVNMKKSRLGTKLSVLAKSCDASALKELIFRHTTAIGVREISVQKTELPRQIRAVNTKFGEVRIKICKFEGGEKIKPEFDDCKNLAQKFGTNIATVRAAAIKEYENGNFKGRD
ncbi:nickel pincer cofactor biosynthesis protein LarC [Campylobacter sp. JMF_04 NA10]|uniref:nickel pincer cofactor biosynthesis protein LarC n=1 Tax=Campylobacter sp. JMF_04 NA10 TaxID=2983824 RepID=UPI0022E9AECB|nr:nickel pincer cofactor biosynthesis protein LarC [Campylobacter sp. JMF_04 NA10]MDA3077039.1 nickel pincer cofactor biosynthesis protein LarC [Campylobacter sp. JMF_04 NA10]